VVLGAAVAPAGAGGAAPLALDVSQLEGLRELQGDDGDVHQLHWIGAAQIVEFVLPLFELCLDKERHACRAVRVAHLIFERVLPFCDLR